MYEIDSLKWKWKENLVVRPEFSLACCTQYRTNIVKIIFHAPFIY